MPQDEQQEDAGTWPPYTECPICRALIQHAKPLTKGDAVICPCCNWSAVWGVTPKSDKPTLLAVAGMWVAAVIVLAGPWSVLHYAVPCFDDWGWIRHDISRKPFIIFLKEYYWWLIALYAALAGIMPRLYDPDEANYNALFGYPNYDGFMMALHVLVYPATPVSKAIDMALDYIKRLKN